MNNAIQETKALLFHPQCNNCGEVEGTLVFELNVNPVGNSRQVMTWCPACAREVIEGLSSAFDWPLSTVRRGDCGEAQTPLWLTAMRNLSSAWSAEGEAVDELFTE